MSYHDRQDIILNTALITTVTPDDFPSDSPLAGLEFQRKYEELAYKIGNGKIPVQLFGDFLKNQMSTKLGNVTPSIKGEWQFANLHECLPDYVCASLEEGMRAFGHKIKGYDAEDTVFSGVETRTSSPLRMERNKQFESNIQGLFPCGEGAGYAGGITSAAMDGIKTAEAIAEKDSHTELSTASNETKLDCIYLQRYFCVYKRRTIVYNTTECTLGVFLVLGFVRRFREYIGLKRRKFYE